MQCKINGESRVFSSVKQKNYSAAFLVVDSLRIASCKTSTLEANTAGITVHR